jgi:hypothetical protein
MNAMGQEPSTEDRTDMQLGASVIKLGATPEAAAATLGDLDQDVLDRFQQIVMGDRKMRWAIVQRGFWVHGVDNLRDFLRARSRSPWTTAPS